MGKKAFAFRFDPVLIGRVDRVRGLVPRTAWLEDVIRKALPPEPPVWREPPAVPDALGDLVGVQVEKGELHRTRLSPVRHPWRCRVRSCDFSAPSEAARCGRHSGKLVENV